MESNVPVKPAFTQSQFNIAKAVDYVDVKVTEANNCAPPSQDSYGINIVGNQSFRQTVESRSKSNSKRSKVKQNEQIKDLIKCVALTQGPSFE